MAGQRTYRPRIYRDFRRGHPDEGLSREELLHAITIAVPTAGFPATAAAYGWALEVLDSDGGTVAEGDGPA